MQRTTLRSSRSAATQLYAHILNPYIDPRGLAVLAPVLLYKYCCRNRLELHVFARRQERYVKPDMAGLALVSLLLCRERRSTGSAPRGACGQLCCPLTSQGRSRQSM